MKHKALKVVQKLSKGCLVSSFEQWWDQSQTGSSLLHGSTTALMKPVCDQWHPRGIGGSVGAEHIGRMALQSNRLLQGHMCRRWRFWMAVRKLKRLLRKLLRHLSAKRQLGKVLCAWSRKRSQTCAARKHWAIQAVFGRRELLVKNLARWQRHALTLVWLRERSVFVQECRRLGQEDLQEYNQRRVNGQDPRCFTRHEREDPVSPRSPPSPAASLASTSTAAEAAASAAVEVLVAVSRAPAFKASSLTASRAPGFGSSSVLFPSVGLDGKTPGVVEGFGGVQPWMGGGSVGSESETMELDKEYDVAILALNRCLGDAKSLPLPRCINGLQTHKLMLERTDASSDALACNQWHTSTPGARRRQLPALPFSQSRDSETCGPLPQVRVRKGVFQSRRGRTVTTS